MEVWVSFAEKGKSGAKMERERIMVGVDASGWVALGTRDGTECGNDGSATGDEFE